MWLWTEVMKARVLRAAVFLLLLFWLLSSCSRVFLRKPPVRKMTRFFEETEDFDVLFTGVSHMQYGVFPMELWNEFGITAFNFGESGCRIPHSYWVLKMALQYASPKLVVMDVRRIDLDTAKTLDYVKNVLDGFPLTPLKAMAAFDLFDDWNEAAAVALPLVNYHYRWESLDEGDFVVSGFRIDNGAARYKGKKLRVASPEQYPYVEADDKLEGAPLSVRYLKEMIELCQSKGIEVLLTELPFPATEEDQRYANGIQDIADEYGVNYVNFHHLDTVDLKTDLSNTDHLNDSGAKKVTHALGVYITEHYAIPDRREDPAFDAWQKQAEEYKEYKIRRLNERTDPKTFLMLLRDRDLDVQLTLPEGSGCYERPLLMRLIRNICEEGKLKRLGEAAAGKLAYTACIGNASGSITETVGADALQAEGDLLIRVFDSESGAEILQRSFEL